MSRFFIEVAYKGTQYGGFQRQDNSNTIQAEVERALKIYFRHEILLTGSSRTDAGVHARQNFFHFDDELLVLEDKAPRIVYHLNAILPPDIMVRSLRQVADTAHCRFDASSRTYQYTIYQQKNPFLQDIAFFYPYRVNFDQLLLLAEEFKHHSNFEAFAKRNTQVFTFNCQLSHSEWIKEEDRLVYVVTANRFLRGMVKGLVGTMLRASTRQQTIEEVRDIIVSLDPARVNFAVAAHGLCLEAVTYPSHIGGQ